MPIPMSATAISSVQPMYTVQRCISANPDTSNWNTSNVNDMQYMFSGASLANPDVKSWDVSTSLICRTCFGCQAAQPDFSSCDHRSRWYRYAPASMLVAAPPAPSSFSLPPTTTRPMGCSRRQCDLYHRRRCPRGPGGQWLDHYDGGQPISSPPIQANAQWLFRGPEPL